MRSMIIGSDFPHNELKFDEIFSTEEACRDYFFKVKWSDGFVCTKCNNRSYWLNNRGLFVCRTCDHQESLTANTMLSGTKKPLKLWFKAIWMCTTKKTGVSACSMQKLLGLSYQTAWTWLQKIRLCSVQNDREKLSGTVEVDEFYLGGKEEGRQGRGAEKKIRVVVAVEKNGRKTGRIRMQTIKDTSSNSLIPFIQSNIKEGSLVKTDGWTGYLPLHKKDYEHIREIASKGDDNSLLPGVHLVASQMKRMILGIYQGRVEEKHIQKYLDEFVFRYNRRTSRSVGLKFFRLLEIAKDKMKVPYWRIIERIAPHIPLWEITT